jgi:hypothetical protein
MNYNNRVVLLRLRSNSRFESWSAVDFTHILCTPIFPSPWFLWWGSLCVVYSRFESWSVLILLIFYVNQFYLHHDFCDGKACVLCIQDSRAGLLLILPIFYVHQFYLHHDFCDGKACVLCIHFQPVTFDSVTSCSIQKCRKHDHI